MFSFLDRLNPFKKRKKIDISTINIPRVDINIEQIINSSHSSVLAGTNLEVMLSPQIPVNCEEIIYPQRTLQNLERLERINSVLGSIPNYATFFNRENLVQTADDIDDIPKEIVQYTKKKNLNWLGVIERIKDLPVEKQIHFHCPILQDLINSPPLQIIGILGTPIHIFDGRTILEAIRHNGLVHPVTRENFTAKQIQYGDDAINYVEAMLAEYIDTYSKQVNGMHC